MDKRAALKQKLNEMKAKRTKRDVLIHQQEEQKKKFKKQQKKDDKFFEDNDIPIDDELPDLEEY